MLGRLCVVVLSTLLIACEIRAQYRFDVCEDYCKKKENACPEFVCAEEDGRIVKNATICGCCHICITKLNEDEECATEFYGIASGNLKECGEGLVCHKKERKCVKASTQCVIKQKEFDDKPPAKHQMLQRERPDCNYFGYFESVVCLPDVLCYCVNKEGKRIFGTDFAERRKTMNCACSREITDFPKYDEVEDGNFPRCLPNGNYDPLQCSDERCFCMNSTFPDDDVSINGTLEKLSCYNKDMHKNVFTSNCWEERNAEMALIRNESLTAVVGLNLTRCELDGSYSPVQCKKNRCYCVTKYGKRYSEYDVDRRSSAENMTCRCARDKEILRDVEKKTKSIEFFEKIECNTLGNYKRIQTVEAESFQVDEMGFRIT